MNLKVKIAALPIPPGDYKKEDFNQMVRKLNQLIDNVFNPGDLVATTLQFVTIAGEISLPASGYGLPVGGVYYDENGFLKIVRNGEAFAPSFMARVKMRPVTVTT